MSAENSGHKPFLPDDAQMPEFTFQAVLTGTLLGLVFSASSLYLVLKVGMTVSASIPVAVLAITLFRAFSKMFRLRQTTVLENNIVQTAGSAGESIAFGVGVTMPALLLLGYSMDLPRVMVVSILGGLLGILAMIPLRRAFIVRLHGRPGQPGTLLYPEGTACAQVLISGEKGGSTGATVFLGFGIAFAHKFVTEGMSMLVAAVKVPVTFINKAAVFAGEMASELLGVGYIIGIRTSAIMMAGAILGYMVILPLIYFVGEFTPVAVPPGTKPIKEMGLGEIRNNYLLFIGAGCVATAGILSMLRTLPMIFRSIGSGLTSLKGGKGGFEVKKRTEDDMSMTVVLGGSFGLIVLLALFLASQVPLVSAVAGAVLVVLFGFLFVTVSSRLTGEIGSSSNPISGMTVATLMLTCLIFLALGWTSSTERVLALSVAAVVCVAASNGGTTAQSLKTGFLIGGTPKYAQYAILIGAVVSALVIGATLLTFNRAGTIYTQKDEHVPKNFTFTQVEVDRLQESETFKGKDYKLYDSRNDILTAPDGKTGYTPRKEILDFKGGPFLIDLATRKPEYLKDPAIMGKLTETDEGESVEREFEAPKTQVMGIIINGVLKRDLNWTMVAIGAMIAFMLELCGVSALAFAVGVYVPIQYSVPIFLGGIVRWGVDSWMARKSAGELKTDDPEAKAKAEVEAIRRSETNPGVLLASGYIAGGSIAGVLLAFFAFSDTLPRDIGQWQYAKVAVEKAGTLEELSKEAARKKLGEEATTVKVEELAKEIAGLNKAEGLLYQLVKVPAGTELTTAGKKNFQAAKETTLQELAREHLGRGYFAQALFQSNPGKLKLPESLPAGTELKLPQEKWPAVAWFLGLIAILGITGAGWLFSTQENSKQDNNQPTS